MDGLTTRFKERARAEGFDLVGIAATGPAATAVHLQRWLEAGMHGDMAFMARTVAERADPSRLLSGCRSVAAVAMSYHTLHPVSTSSAPDDRARVWISRYAWGRDYHKIMKKALVRLGRWLTAQRPSARWRATVDTAPILEREWAARAGLGWIGKNTSLLNRRLGSELFLGLLLTDVELAPDGPVPEHCGRCTACLDACPTSAFPTPRLLDARRCVSYLTVEHRHQIPAALRPAMDAMVAGCDICQEVCPWTVRAHATSHPHFEPAPHRFRPLLAELEAMDEEAYRQWRSGSPLTRIPHAQFRRSLAAARANQGRHS